MDLALHAYFFVGNKEKNTRNPRAQYSLHLPGKKKTTQIEDLVYRRT